jgi:hypothetical protein
MSNTPKPNESQNDALAALHGLHKSNEHDQHDDHEEHDIAPSPAESAQASGFVGMLAKEGAGSAPDAGGSSGAPIPRGRTDEIRMAREIEVAPRPAPAFTPPPTTVVRRKVAAKVPGWYHIAVPVMYTLGALLFLIGVWALGAVVYMLVHTPKDLHDIGYPWISGIMDLDTEVVTYASASKIMAGAMLVCLPVALAMAVMANIMRKRIATAK